MAGEKGATFCNDLLKGISNAASITIYGRSTNLESIQGRSSNAETLYGKSS